MFQSSLINWGFLEWFSRVAVLLDKQNKRKKLCQNKINQNSQTPNPPKPHRNRKVDEFELTFFTCTLSIGMRSGFGDGFWERILIWLGWRGDNWYIYFWSNPSETALSLNFMLIYMWNSWNIWIIGLWEIFANK